MTRERLIAGNWKMNGLLAARAEIDALLAGLKAAPATATVAVCPPATLLVPFAGLLKGSSVRLGGQDCHFERSGASPATSARRCSRTRVPTT